jgi:hypothetical protein
MLLVLVKDNILKPVFNRASKYLMLPSAKALIF